MTEKLNDAHRARRACGACKVRAPDRLQFLHVLPPLPEQSFVGFWTSLAQPNSRIWAVQYAQQPLYEHRACKCSTASVRWRERANHPSGCEIKLEWEGGRFGENVVALRYCMVGGVRKRAELAFITENFF
ncbi:hypothetical protein QAD02_011952 [Eretmocerus hayati]|uniref:Uncharacterized protein n=1 Tax=Eretmocerus hayati TaxID=131215 RepID=A0ACC2NZZ8_9HYME|nr:hypothetical protein QAD02_011952 [Eretmocerus hayati]